MNRFKPSLLKKMRIFYGVIDIFTVFGEKGEREITLKLMFRFVMNCRDFFFYAYSQAKRGFEFPKLSRRVIST